MGDEYGRGSNDYHTGQPSRFKGNSSSDAAYEYERGRRHADDWTKLLSGAGSKSDTPRYSRWTPSKTPLPARHRKSIAVPEAPPPPPVRGTILGWNDASTISGSKTDLTVKPAARRSFWSSPLFKILLIVLACFVARLFFHH